MLPASPWPLPRCGAPRPLRSLAITALRPPVATTACTTTTVTGGRTIIRLCIGPALVGGGSAGGWLDQAKNQWLHLQFTTHATAEAHLDLTLNTHPIHFRGLIAGVTGKLFPTVFQHPGDFSLGPKRHLAGIRRCDHTTQVHPGRCHHRAIGADRRQNRDHAVFRQLLTFLQNAGIDDAETICLVHNAARLAHDSVADVSASDLRSVYEINLIAPAVLNRALLPAMAVGSSILYVGSTLGEKAVPGSFSYVTSKHATIGMMRATCQDLAGSGVHTACINPGFTDTEMLRDHIPADVMPEIAQMSAYGRLIDPAEIASALFFAAQNPVINGSVINANLGQIER